jgi:Kef-type K+ transport system membrane component KefB
MDIFLVDMMVVFAAAVLLGIALRFFRLPSLVGQVLAGFVFGSLRVFGAETIEVMRLFSTLGVTLLLFLVGLEMNWQGLRHSGKMVFKLFWLQTTLLTGLYGLFSFWVLGLGVVPSIMLAIALTFSSTILVVKTLSEEKDLGSFVGNISLGMLLLQDLLAIVILTLIPGLKNSYDWTSIGALAWKIGLILLVVNVFGHYLISWLMKSIIKSSEDLIMFSLVWFFMSVYFSTHVLGLSPEIGGILAGLSLSTSWGHYQIVSKVKTLRDVFLTVFFVLLGFEVGTDAVNWILVLQIVTLVILGKLVITGVVAIWCGLKRKTAFSLSINMTQISEFALIVMSIGLASSLWGSDLVSAVTVAGLITMVTSTILMTSARSIYKFWTKILPKIFLSVGREGESLALKGHIVLLGGDRTGRSIMSFLKKNGETVLIVDFNPEIVKKLKNRGDKAIFADVSDPDLLDITDMREAKMVISTVKDVHDSLALLSEMLLKGVKVPVIVDAESASQAADLYRAGASYVIFPHFVSGLHLGQLMKRFEQDTTTLSRYRTRQNEALKEIYDGEF